MRQNLLLLLTLVSMASYSQTKQRNSRTSNRSTDTTKRLQVNNFQAKTLGDVLMVMAKPTGQYLPKSGVQSSQKAVSAETTTPTITKADFRKAFALDFGHPTGRPDEMLSANDRLGVSNRALERGLQPDVLTTRHFDTIATLRGINTGVSSQTAPTQNVTGASRVGSAAPPDNATISKGPSTPLTFAGPVSVNGTLGLSEPTSATHAATKNYVDTQVTQVTSTANSAAATSISNSTAISALSSALAGKQPMLTAGTNITITGNTISAVTSGTGTAAPISFDASLTTPGGTTVVNATNPLTTSKLIKRVVLNVAQLRQWRPTQQYHAETRGYYSLEDGGAAQYYYDSTSTALDDSAFVINPTVGTGKGRWIYLVRDRTVNAKQLGAQGTGTSDDTRALQKGINYIIDRALKLHIPTGNYKITAKLVIGTNSPPFHPYNQSAFEIYGDSPTADYNYRGSDSRGTQIILYGTGHKAILEVNTSAYSMNHYHDFTLTCATKNGARDGFSFNGTGFTEHRLTNVQSIYARKAFAIRYGVSANGEFITFTKCRGIASENFLYMDAQAGQSFGHYFQQCIGAVDDGGAIWEIGGGGGGYNLTAVECEMSVNYNYTPGDSQNPFENQQNWVSGATFLRNSGVTGTLNFLGGRSETINTIVHTVQSSYNQTGRIFLKGIQFEGMSSNMTRPSLKSTGVNSMYSYSIEDCYFSGFGNFNKTNVSWNTDLGTGDASSYIFTRCQFENFKTFANSAGRDDACSLIYRDCGREGISGPGYRFSRSFDWHPKEDKNTYGIPQNLLLQSGFKATGGGGITPNSPWIMYGNTQTIDMQKFPDVNVSPYTSSPDASRLMIGSSSGIYQDVMSVDFSGPNVYAKYEAVVQPSWANMTLVFSLENASSGRVYDQKTVKVPSSFRNDSRMLIKLEAIDGGTVGNLRVRIYNSGETGFFFLHKQWVATVSDAAFVPTTTSAKSFSHVWSASNETLRATTRFQMPSKDDVYGAANNLPDVAPGEVYYSVNTNRERVYDGTRWNERPQSDFGTTAPINGTWPTGFIRYNSAPTELGTVGSKYIIEKWICTVGGSPGTWLQGRVLTGN